MYKILRRIQRQFFFDDPAPLDDTIRAKRPTRKAVADAFEPLMERLPERADTVLVEAIALIACDHIDSAHKLIQKREDDAACYVHGIVHRREGDYANACYWFRRCGADFPALWLIGEAIEADDRLQPIRLNFPNLIQDGRFMPSPMAGVVQQVYEGGHINLGSQILRAQAHELSILLAYAAGKDHQKAKQLMEQATSSAR